jgi:hypothetical protein
MFVPGGECFDAEAMLQMVRKSPLDGDFDEMRSQRPSPRLLAPEEA